MPITHADLAEQSRVLEPPEDFTGAERAAWRRGIHDVLAAADRLDGQEEAPVTRLDGDGMLVCASCGRSHEPIEPGMTQAYGCAAFFGKGRIVGFYGSTEVDLQEWRATSKMPDWAKPGIICDACIRKLKAESAITFESEGL